MSILTDIRDFFTFGKPEQTEKRGLGLQTLFPNANPYTTDKALTLSAVWCAIRLLAESVSSLPCSVYYKEANGDKVESVKNRIVIFDSNIPHTGTTVTNKQRRVVLNINYYPNS